MYLFKTRKHDRHMRRYKGIFRTNAVLTMGLALPLAISATFSLQGAVCVIAGMFAATLPVMVLASLVGEKIPVWLRTPVYGLCAVALLIPVQMWLTSLLPVVIDSIGVYFPIIAVNTVMLYRCERVVELHKGVFKTLSDAFRHLLGFALVMIIAASLRELLGNGTLWGIPISGITFKLGGLLIPFGGCIVVAFMAAGAKFFGRLSGAALYRSDLRQREYAEEFGDEFSDFN